MRSIPIAMRIKPPVRRSAPTTPITKPVRNSGAKAITKTPAARKTGERRMRTSGEAPNPQSAHINARGGVVGIAREDIKIGEVAERVGVRSLPHK
jgi:hypothetical protein